MVDGRTVALIQARTGSTRLPGKVFREIAGETLLQRLMSRISHASTIEEWVVATTKNSRDDLIETFAQDRDFAVFRGEEEDVLDRFYRAAIEFRATTIVRICSDNPLLDSSLVDDVVSLFQNRDVDYASNGLPPQTFPLGLGVEVFSFESLKAAWEEDTDPRRREHVTPFILQHPDQFRLLGMRHSRDLSHMRWTVDTPEDLEFVETVFRHFGHGHFSWIEAAEAVEAHPSWQKINRHIEQNTL